MGARGAGMGTAVAVAVAVGGSGVDVAVTVAVAVAVALGVGVGKGVWVGGMTMEYSKVAAAGPSAVLATTTVLTSLLAAGGLDGR